MALLPKKVGSVTLMRSIVTDGVHTAYAGILDDPPGKACVVQRLPTTLTREPARAAQVTNRIRDLIPVHHDSLLGVLEHLHDEDEQYLVTEWTDSVSLDDVIKWCQDAGTTLPHNLFLHIAIGICNALDALHGRPGIATGTEAVLHLALEPSAVRLTRDGEVKLCNFGLVPAPTTTAHTGGLRIERLHISPEQTQLVERLTPASDLFSLGAVLYELLALKPMFAGPTPLRTIAMVRNAQVTTQLLEVKEVFPGLDRVMYRMLAPNPRHRYQRAFVLREDLRALKVGFSFSNIEDEARTFLEPMFLGMQRIGDEILPPLPFATPDGETTLSLLDDSDGIVAPMLQVEEIDSSTPAPLQARPSVPTIDPAVDATPGGLDKPRPGPRPMADNTAPTEPMPTPGVPASETAGSGAATLPLFVLVFLGTASLFSCLGIGIAVGVFSSS